MMTDAPAVGALVAFDTWEDPEIDACRVPTDGGYSRTAWLPVLGSTAWIVWGTLAGRLQSAGPVHCALGELAPAHAAGPSVVPRALARLEAFGLAYENDPGTWMVRSTCPPLWDRLLARAPSPVHAAHRATFLPSRSRSPAGERRGPGGPGGVAHPTE
jgi:hypothetical protein